MQQDQHLTETTQAIEVATLVSSSNPSRIIPCSCFHDRHFFFASLLERLVSSTLISFQSFVLFFFLYDYHFFLLRLSSYDNFDIFFPTTAALPKRLPHYPRLRYELPASASLQITLRHFQARTNSCSDHRLSFVTVYLPQFD